jgi:hypothetical protein
MPIEKISIIVHKETDYESVYPIVNKLNELIETVNFLKNEFAVHHNTLMLMSMDLQDIRKCQ